MLQKVPVENYCGLLYGLPLGHKGAESKDLANLGLGGNILIVPESLLDFAGGVFMTKLFIFLLIISLFAPVDASSLTLDWDYVLRTSVKETVTMSQLRLAGSGALNWETMFYYLPGELGVDRASLDFSLHGIEHRFAWGHPLPHFQGRMSIVGGNVQPGKGLSYTVKGKEGPWSATGVVLWGSVFDVWAAQLKYTQKPWQLLLTGCLNSVDYPGEKQHMYVVEGQTSLGNFTLQGALGMSPGSSPSYARYAQVDYRGSQARLLLSYRNIDGDFVTPAKSSFSLGRGRKGWELGSTVSIGPWAFVEVTGSDLTNLSGQRQYQWELVSGLSLGEQTLRVGKGWNHKYEEWVVYGLVGPQYEVRLTQGEERWQGRLQLELTPQLTVRSSYDTGLSAVRVQGDLALDGETRLRGLVRYRHDQQKLQYYASLSKTVGPLQVELDWGTWDQGRLDAYWQHPSALGVKVVYHRAW